MNSSINERLLSLSSLLSIIIFLYAIHNCIKRMNSNHYYSINWAHILYIFSSLSISSFTIIINIISLPSRLRLRWWCITTFDDCITCKLKCYVSPHFAIPRAVWAYFLSSPSGLRHRTLCGDAICACMYVLASSSSILPEIQYHPSQEVCHRGVAAGIGVKMVIGKVTCRWWK